MDNHGGGNHLCLNELTSSFLSTLDSHQYNKNIFLLIYPLFEEDDVKKRKRQRSVQVILLHFMKMFI